ncbi:MAG: cytochrome c biogenesis CcdA family protein [Acetobacteraceae bacterium]
MTAGSLIFGFLAGVLSIFSPCVLPLLPMVLGPAASADRMGAPALAAGLVASFVAVGLFVATVGFSLGLDAGVFQDAAAVLLAVFGAVMLSETLQRRFAYATAGLSSAGGKAMARFAPSGAGGQFVIGLLLGAVWSPCVGPTLGAAAVLAAQGRDLAGVAGVMAAFGLGTAVPLLALGLLSQRAFWTWRGRMMAAGRAGKVLLGTAALLVAVLILTGLEHRLEGALVATSPGWLTALTTRF